MDYIKRPRKVERVSAGKITERNFQENTEHELNKVYDKIDEIIDELDNASHEIIVNNNYENLINKPQIEGNTLIGNKAYDELGLIKVNSTEIDTMMNN